MTDLSSFFRERYVELFNRGVAMLEAGAGDSPEAEAVHVDVKGARGASRLRFEGQETESDTGQETIEVWLSLADGVMSALDERPEGVPARLSVSMPRAAADLWVLEIEGRENLDSDEAALRLAKGASRRMEDAIGDEALDFHLIIKDTPDFDEVVVRVALHAVDLPEKPTFTATVRWDDLEEMRGAGKNLQQLMMGGKLRLGGDYTRAMQVALELMDKSR
ncbi:MAG: SCP2 sterol-binding domain-containing protein [Deltaproteobacteria bacterium]|nr:SCP2 sterol-binding domain-containing protein [Deltaproteobacteria bacterium]